LIQEIILLQALIGGLGGLLGSLLHLLGQHKTRRKLYTNPLSLKEDIFNMFGWTISAMITGSLFGASNPLWGFVMGLATGLLGVEGYKRLAMYLNPKQHLMYLLERNKGLKSKDALNRLINSFDFIENVDIVEKLGEIDIKLEPSNLYNSAMHLPLLEDIINSIKPMGIIMNIIEPTPMIITLSGQLHLAKDVNFGDVESKAQVYIHKHINSLGLGENFKLPILQAAISRGAIPGVLDLYSVVTNPQLSQRQSIEVPNNMLPKAGKVSLKAA
jgi:hypothetical protein